MRPSRIKNNDTKIVHLLGHWTKSGGSGDFLDRKRTGSKSSLTIAAVSRNLNLENFQESIARW